MSRPGNPHLFPAPLAAAALPILVFSLALLQRFLHIAWGAGAILLFPVILLALIQVCSRKKSRPLSVALATASFLAGAGSFLGYAYWKTSGVDWEEYLSWQSLPVAGQTLLRTLNTVSLIKLTIATLLFAALTTLATRFAASLARSLPTLSRWRTASLIALVLLFCADLSFVYGYLNEISSREENRRNVPVWMPSRIHLRNVPKDSVFMLQLESLNSLYLYGEEKGVATPVLTKLGEESIFFPYFWANTTQTHRAMESILCGISANPGDAFSYRPEQITTNCLPEILRSAGYRTIFFYSFNDLGFFNYSEFLPRLGFSEIVHGTDLMKPGDPLHDWGYDDCVFYDRAFDYLNRTRRDGEKLFAYFAVSMHHYPFLLGADPGKPWAPLKERYRTSAGAQDRCLSRFLDRQRQYAGDQSHLLVFGDHSHPVGLQGYEYQHRGFAPESFLTPLAYQPPQRARADLALGPRPSLQPSQDQLRDTLIEWMTGDAQPQSFARAIASPLASPKTHCRAVVQPYDGGWISIISGAGKFSYSLRTRELRRYWLSENLREGEYEILRSDLSSREFMDLFGCEHMREDGL